MIKVKRIMAGEYEVSSDRFPGKKVYISKVYYPNDGWYWIYNPNFCNIEGVHRRTKKEAVESALYVMETN